MFIVLDVLILIFAAVLWVVLASRFGRKTYNNAEKIYKNLTEDEPEEDLGEESKGAKENV